MTRSVALRRILEPSRTRVSGPRRLAGRSIPRDARDRRACPETRREPVKRRRLTLSLFSLILAVTSVHAARRADAQRAIRPHLDHFGVPYDGLDVATTSVSSTIADYAVIRCPR